MTRAVARKAAKVIPLSGVVLGTDACRMRTFHLYRTKDLTGVSGTGKVAEGVVFSNGWVAMTWLSDQPSISFYTSIDQVEAIHGHNGTTRVVFAADAETGFLASLEG